MVFLEIIRNAIKFSPVSGLIHVQVSVNEELLKISIRDNGEGIAKAETGLIFEKFYRAHRNKKDYISGFGIGLYLAKNIVDMHGGSIGVESESHAAVATGYPNVPSVFTHDLFGNI